MDIEGLSGAFNDDYSLPPLSIKQRLQMWWDAIVFVVRTAFR
jgi:hypothetical protein